MDGSQASHPTHGASSADTAISAAQSHELQHQDSTVKDNHATTHVEEGDVPRDPSWDEAHAGTGLSPEAREYLLKRHGTLDLDPMPSPTDADPYNWPQSKKLVMLLLVALHAGMITFTAGGIIPAYSDMAEEFGVSIQDASYLTSLQILVLGLSPLVWRPLANTYGRRPIFLQSLLLAAIFNIACAVSNSYGLLMFFRAVNAFFLSPASSIGSAVVAETFLKKDRGKYIGVWMVMITLGVPVGPLIFGVVTYKAGFRLIFWILAIINGVQLVLYFFFGPETLFIRSEDDAPPQMNEKRQTFKSKYLNFRRINPRRLSVADYVEPLKMVARPCAVLPALSYSVVFLFGSIIITIEIPQLFESKFELNTAQLGLQFIGVIVGSLLGEQVGGVLSDVWMRMWTKKRGIRPPPEFRLWLSYAGYVLTIVGVAVFLVTTEEAPAGKWTVVPVVGTAIAAAGNQVVTTVLVTYAVDSAAEKAASVGVFVSLARQVIGFIGPFWYVHQRLECTWVLSCQVRRSR